MKPTPLQQSAAILARSRAHRHLLGETVQEFTPRPPVVRWGLTGVILILVAAALLVAAWLSGGP